MPENGYFSRDDRHVEDAAQKHEHLNNMTPDELMDALSDMWDATDEVNYDPAQIDAYLTELEKREPISPGFDVDASLAAFHEKHARLIEQSLPVQLSTDKKPVHRRRWHTSLIAAIVAVVMMFCSMVTAQAFGFDIFGAIAQWTEDTFHFSITSQPSNDQKNMPIPATDGEFATLQESLDAYGFLETVSPRWYPAGFKTVEVSVFPRATGVTIHAFYELEEKTITVSVRQYANAEEANISIGSFEKDSNTVTKYECNSITHYIMSNNFNYTATWANDALVCSISGDLTMDELSQMIDSIYEG